MEKISRSGAMAMTMRTRAADVASDEAAVLVLAGVAAGALLSLGVQWFTRRFLLDRVGRQADDPVLAALAEAPADDEPLSPEDIAASDAGWADLRAGRTRVWSDAAGDKATA
jgi:hypothetical protein